MDFGSSDEYPIKPLPAFLPEALSYCNQANSEAELLNLLIKNTGDLLIFFETMCADETWSERHTAMVRNLIDWLTVQGFYDKLTDDTYKRTSHALCQHAALFAPYIPKNITIQLKDGAVQANSLLLAAAAPFFKDAIRRANAESSSKLSFVHVSKDLFEPMLEFVNTGAIRELWKLREEEIISLLRQALSWGLDAVVRECAEVLKRYVTRENVFDRLATAELEHWNYFRQICADFINGMSMGFSLFIPAVDRLKAIFADFNESTLQHFQCIQHMVTDVACAGDLSSQRGFIQVIAQAPKLIALDLSRSTAFNDNLYSVPTDLQELNLAKCSWLSQQMLRKMSEICPQVKRLQLGCNQQLNFAAWGELSKFKQLTQLDVSECQQISNDDLSVILGACRGVLDLNLSECHKLTEQGFVELTKKATRLTHLNLSRTSLADHALIEIATRCPSLRAMTLVACANVTAKGVAECLKHAPALKVLDISLCRLPPPTVLALQLAHPYVTITAADEW